MNAAIFDMDGVLVDNNFYHKEAWLMFLEQFGYHLTDQETSQYVYGKTNSDILNQVFQKQLNEDKIRELSHQKEVIYRDLYRDHIKAPLGLIPLLEALAEIGPIGVATSAPPQNLDFVLDELKIRHFFSALVHGEMVKNGKPHPEIYLLVARLMEVEPKECVVFEDSLVGIAAGQTAGMKVIAITSTFPIQQLAHADQVIDSFNQYHITGN